LAEESANGEFASFFGGLIKSPRPVSLAQAQATLRDIQAQTGESPALLYVRLNRSSNAQKPGESALELLLITGDREPTRVKVLNATADDILKTQEQLRRQLTNPSLTNNTAYLAAAQRLYQWLIAPIEADLQAAGISNIGFVMDAGLRTLPLAALHNGEQFLIETYNVGLIPSLGLIDPTYVALNRQNSSLLVSGASQFINQPPLLAAEVEMSTLQAFWPGTKVAETRFTVNNLQQSRQQAQIIHLATHAQFLRGAPDSSYLQFFDNRLRLNQMADLGWFDPQVELVTLSACQTAMGNIDAELGFAGFALVAGAKSALASLWKVSDEATAGLMTTFYQALDQEAIKAEALRQAQLAMIRGQVYTESGQLIWPGGALTLPPDLVVDGRQDLSHPFYWAAFTMVGSPW
jgi:CHAT domain-containing protein